MELESELEALLLAGARAGVGAGESYFLEAGAEAKYKMSQWH